jgi:small-conductance mechanosensitive channel
MQADSLVEELSERVRTEWSDLFNWPELTATGLRVLAAFVVGWLAFWALKLLLRRIERSIEPSESGLLTVQEQRSKTLLSLVRSIGIVVIIVLMIFMVLGALGINLGPLLAGAGVIGLAVSFGAQSLVKDVISGLFILFENQYGVGDVIRLDTGISGSVERMTLRVVVLRDVFGVVHIVPNGEIKRVSNLTRTWSRAVLDVGVAYKEDADRVMEVMREVGQEMREDPEWKHFLVEDVTVPGIESFGESSVNIRIMAKTVPLKQWDVARELRPA